MKPIPTRSEVNGNLDPKSITQQDEFANASTHLKIKYFSPQKSRCGGYTMYKFLLEDRQKGLNYCVKVNENILQKLFKDILNSED